MRKYLVALAIAFGFAVALFLPQKALAVSYDLVPPTGTLTRGQNVQFIIDIDTQGSTLNTATVGMTFNTQYLQYVSATQGDAMPNNFKSQVTGSGTLVISGDNTAGYSGSGVFAYVTFQLIASAPGSTELCVLFAPSTTPVPATPTLPPNVPTALPTTGYEGNTGITSLIGTLFIVLSAGSFIWLKRNRYVGYHKKIHRRR